MRSKGKTLFISQTAYVSEILSVFNLDNCVPNGSQSDLSIILSETDSPQTDEEKSAMANVPYREAVGMLNWLAMMTRPDIAYATSVVSRFAANPGKAHTGMR